MNIIHSPQSGKKSKINWDQIIRAANSIQIDDFFISSLHTRFDPEEGVFQTQSNDL